LGVSWAIAVTLYAGDVLPGRSGQMLSLVIAVGILTFMGFVHASSAIYSMWIRFASALHVVVITVLFGAVYLAIVPLFALMVWPFDVLGLRGSARAKTFWISKRRVGSDLNSFQRIG
jgi:hypothetical protein